ncbi:hypothetical protein chiPu_0005098 [Chiloscyllium punctatum]|uniref:Uncharacterized protein n=1 Tax=Chiloscyllium punctatum TaxID=137246 RepID=A0A401S8L7_CHIPU|nr:hypothetical protein [Chiloscyllium punctatum]
MAHAASSESIGLRQRRNVPSLRYALWELCRFLIAFSARSVLTVHRRREPLGDFYYHFYMTRVLPNVTIPKLKLGIYKVPRVLKLSPRGCYLSVNP